MNDVNSLNAKFSAGGQVVFKQLAAGVAVAEIDNALATATVSLYGGQVVTWCPKSQQEPVLWLSELAKFTFGKAIRGGVPICWPWFGAHPTNASAPGHGYARISPWDVVSIQPVAGGATRIALKLAETDQSNAHWSGPVSLLVFITIGDSLEVELTTTNESDQEITLTEGLHTYFNIGDLSDIRVLGLESCEYVDLIGNNVRRKQVGPIEFAGELGRIYLNTDAACTIEDSLLKRRIRIEKAGSFSTAVWNPWEITAAKMGDIEPAGWRKMVCVESANALENAVTVAKKDSHTMSVTYTVQNIL